MPRAPNPLMKKAEKLYRDGMKTPKISEKLGVPVGTVRRWKVEGDWDNERSERSDITSAKEPSARKESKKITSARNKPMKEASARKPRGAPPGNKNAVGNPGGGAPPGNTNNFKHGFYMSVLPQEAQEMIQSRGEISEEQRLLNDLNLWEYRERSLVEAIERQKANDAGLAMARVTKNKDGTTTEAVSTFTNIAHLEKLLSDAQRGYNRCIMALNELRERQRRQHKDDADQENAEPDLSDFSEEELRRLASIDDNEE